MLRVHAHSSRVLSGVLGSALLVLLVGVSPSALGLGEWSVDAAADCNSGDGSADRPFCTIAEAVAVAVDGDTIHIAPGIYGENLVLDADLELIGTRGWEETIVDGSFLDTVITIERDREVVLTGLSIRHGRRSPGGRIQGGGGVRVKNRRLRLTRCRLTGNESPDLGLGGGLSSRRADVIMTDCLVDGNSASHGGGVYNYNGTLRIVGCTFESNVAVQSQPFNGFGGGVRSGGVCTVEDSLFRWNEGNWGAGLYLAGDSSLSRVRIVENEAEFRGGGLFVDQHDALSMTDCEVARNLSRAEGGGVALLFNSTAKITRTDFRDNIAKTHGGALSGGTLVGLNLVDCQIVGNRSGRDGGAIALDRSRPVSLDRCTVWGNVAARDGGALRCRSSNSQSLMVEITNSILWNNEAVEGKEIWLGGENSFLSLSYMDLEGGLEGIVAQDDSPVDPGPGILNKDPLFVDAGAGNFVLTSESPCIDRGDPDESPAGRDFGGRPRFLDGALDRLQIVDLGAHEFSNVELVITGDASPGGTLSFETRGTPGLAVFLFIGTAAGEIALRPYGSLFLDLSQPFAFFPFGVIPNTTDLVVPPDLTTPVELVLQELAVEGLRMNGNFSNSVSLSID